MGLFNKNSEISDTEKELKDYRKKRENEGAYNITPEKFYGSTMQNSDDNGENVGKSTDYNNNIPPNMQNYQHDSQQVHTTYYQQSNIREKYNSSHIIYGHQNINQNQKSSKKGGKFILIWFLVSFIGMFVTFPTYPAVGMLIFGLIFAVIGFYVCFFNGKKREYAGLIFSFIGIAIIAGVLIFWFGSANFVESITKIVPYLFMPIFFFIGLGIMITPYITKKIKIKRCTDKSIAKVVNLQRKRSSKGKYVYCPVYEYLYKGQILVTNDNSYRNFCLPKLGDEFEILINPQDPTDTYVNSNKSKVGNIIFGGIFMAVPIFIMLISLLCV